MWEDLESALEGLPGNLDPLTLTSLLRRELEPERARLAADLYRLRQRAGERFEVGFLPHLNAKGLEQASGQASAEDRAARLAALAPGARVWDATSGLGADAVAALRAGLRVVASDRDLATARLARANLERHGPAHVLVACATRGAVRADLLLLDPDRRPQGRRTLDPRSWSPDLSTCLDLARRHRGAGIKLPPALEGALAEEAARAAGVGPLDLEWVSSGGELVELRAWSGLLADPGDPAGERSVALLRPGLAPVRWRARPEHVEPLAPSAVEGLAVLAEADPAVLRSGLLGNLARRHGLAPLDPHSAYLGAVEGPLPVDPLLRAWRVLGSVPLDRKRVRKLLGEHDIGPLTVKKRGHPDPAETLARRYAGPGRRPGLLAVARLERGHRAFLLEAP